MPNVPPAPTDFEESRARYEEQKEALRTELARGFSGIPRLTFFTISFGSTAVEYVMAGLEKYLEAAAQDRDSAAADRKSAEKDRQADRAAADADKRKQEADRDQQKEDRATMNSLTKAIVGAAIVSALATAWGALRPPSPIVLPAPIVYTAVPAPQSTSCGPPSLTK